MTYDTFVPPLRWLVIAGASALAVLFIVVQSVRIGGIAQLRSATLLPVLAVLVFLLGFHGRDLDLNYSARPLAAEMQQKAPEVQLVATKDVRRDLVYGLAFYRNRQPLELGADDDDPAGEHLLVIPTKDEPQLDRLLAGRVYQQIIEYPARGLQVYKVYAKP